MSGTRSIDALLTERIGLDPESVGSSLVERGLHARITALGLSTPKEYESYLIRSKDEFQALVEEVVVPESWFFRDDRPFTFLQDYVRSRWLIDASRPPLRALSLPCAGGEEPYSIALALLEAGLSPSRFHVDAVDLSARSLTRALQATYSRNAFRGADLGFRDRHFHEKHGRYQLDASVRNTVHFLQGNILDSGLLAHEPAYDVLFCRNLLIYFTDEARRQASVNLNRLLADSGLLFLGHAERLDLAKMQLVAVGDRGTFAYQRIAARPVPTDHQLPAPARPRALEPPHQMQPARLAIASRPIFPPSRPGVAQPPPSFTRVSPAPVASPARGDSALLDQAIERADQGRYAEAVALCEQSMQQSGPTARAYFLLGMIRQAAGDRETAEAALRKAVYLDAQHDEALLALALLAQRRGDTASESSYRRRAERALARKGVR